MASASCASALLCAVAMPSSTCSTLSKVLCRRSCAIRARAGESCTTTLVSLTLCTALLLTERFLRRLQSQHADVVARNSHPRRIAGAERREPSEFDTWHAVFERNQRCTSMNTQQVYSRIDIAARAVSGR